MAGASVVAVVAAGLAVPMASSPAGAATPDCSTAGITVTSLGGPNFYMDTKGTFHSSYTGYRITNTSAAATNDVWVSLSGFTGGSLGLAAGQSPAQRLGNFGAGSATSLFWFLTAKSETTTAQKHVVTVYSHDPSLGNSRPLCSTPGGFAAVDGTTNANANKVDTIDVTGDAPKLGAKFTVSITGETGTIGSGMAGDPYSMWMSPSVGDSWPANAFRLVGTSLTMSPDGSAAAQTSTDILRLADLGGKARTYTATYTFQATGFTSAPTPVMPVQEISSGTQVKFTDYSNQTIPAILSPVSDLKLGLTGSKTDLDTGGGTVHLTARMTGSAGAELDSFVLTPPSGASVKPGSVTWDGQPMPDPVSRGTDLVFPGPFVMPSGDTSLQFDANLDGTTGKRGFSLLGTVGPSYIGTTVAKVDGTNPATYSINVNTAPTAADKAITAGGTTAVDTSPLVADLDSDPLAVTVSTPPAHGSTSVSGGVISYTPTDGYSGPDSFRYTVTDGRGGSATGTVSATVVAPAPTAQAIDFTLPTGLNVGDTRDVSATATSGLPVKLTSGTPDICSVSGGTLTALAAGDCTVAATQDGSSSWLSASVVRTTTIDRKAQAITWAQPDGLQVGGSENLAATADSDLPVTYTTDTTDICTVTDASVTAVAPGTCTVTASQAGNATFAAATPVRRSITVTPAPTTPVAPTSQTITWPQPADLHVGDTLTLTASASSALPVGYATTTPAVCTVSGTSLTAMAAGACTITATQPGDVTHAAADPVSHTITVTAAPTPDPKPQTIDWHLPAGLQVGNPVDLTGTASSGLPVRYGTTTPGVCTVSGSTLTLLTVGQCTITAGQSGDDVWAPAADVTDHGLVAGKDQAITWTMPALHVGERAGLTATATSGLPVTFTSNTPDICALTGSQVTAVTAGECSITAHQDGDDHWAPATPADRTDAVGKRAQTIVWTQPIDLEVGSTTDLVGSADSGLAVGFASASPELCVVDGTGVTALAAGDCRITATQAGDETWAAAPSVEHTVTVVKNPQSIDWTKPADLEVGEATGLSGTAGSGLPVGFDTDTPAVCTVQGTTLTALASGDCTVTATQTGNSTWAPAGAVVHTIGVSKKPQAITWAQPAGLRIGDTADLSASADSGLAVGFDSSSPEVCTVAGAALTAVAAGDCTVTATQDGDDTWNAAPRVTQTVTVGKLPQTITWTLPSGLRPGDTATVTPSASSGLVVSLHGSTPAVCTVSGASLSILATGECTVTATQDGDATWAAAAPVERTATITAAPPQDPVVPTPVDQSISFDPPQTLVTGGSPVPLRASSSSTLPVVLTLVSGACSLDGSQLWTGTDTVCVVRAGQAGGPGFNAAPDVTRQVRFVSPQDDVVAMDSPLGGAADLAIEPLANDPAGLTLASVDQPAHGTSAAGPGGVVYTPVAAFHGDDAFGYHVTDQLGRSAAAVVRIEVADAAPVIRVGSARQLAGTTSVLDIEASDPNGDPLTVTAQAGTPGVTASVQGDRLRVTTDRSVSGVVPVELTADDGYGGVTTARARLLVRPRPVTHADRALSGSGTTVSWSAAATAGARYEVSADGEVACTTTRTECDLDRVLGPDFTVRVRVLGKDGTASTWTAADPSGHHQVLLETVYFASGEHVLGGGQMRKLRWVAHRIRSLGFHDAHVSGYTDSDGGAAYNLELSRQRTRMVSRTLRQVTGVRSEEAWFGYDDPVASNDSDAGKALNRRVEILVSY